MLSALAARVEMIELADRPRRHLNILCGCGNPVRVGPSRT